GLSALLEEHGFDRAQHEQIQADLRSGRIGLPQNRLAASTNIRDVEPDDVVDVTNGVDAALAQSGLEALRDGRAAVISLAGGVGSRWTQGAGTVKALNPFCKFGGKHRTFIEVHLAKSRRISRRTETPVPHIFSTSYLTHGPIERFLALQRN